MRSKSQPNRERVRIDFSKPLLNDASIKAREEGKTLSVYLEGLVLADLYSVPTKQQG
jgi:hypothetical protein